MPVPQFLTHITLTRNSILTIESNVQQLSALHQRLLQSASGVILSTEQNPQDRLGRLDRETRDKSTEVHAQLASLRTDVLHTTHARGEFEFKKRHVASVSADFDKTLRAYLEQERRFEAQRREQVARQYRIVNPDATGEEVARVVEEGGGEGVFAQAVSPLVLIIVMSWIR